MEKFTIILKAFQDLFNGGMNALTAGAWNNLLDMLKMAPGGWSLRKVTAFLSILAGIYIMIFQHTTNPNSTLHACILFGVSLLCQNLITAQQLLEFKQGGVLPTASVADPNVKTKDPNLTPTQ